VTKQQVYEGMLSQMRQLVSKAEIEKRNLTETEAREFNRLDHEASLLKHDIEPHPSMFGENFNCEARTHDSEWRDVSTGKAVRLLGKGESLTEYRRRESGIVVPEYGIGTICRALALGATTDVERRALAEGTQSAGGFLVPTIVSSQLVDAMRAKSAVFQAGARVIQLENAVMNIARVATDPVAAWRNEAAAISESDTVFDQIVFTARALAFYFKVSRELLQDAVNLDTAIQNVIAGAMAAALDQGCLNGSGTPPAIKGVSLISGVGSVSMGTNGAALTNYDPFVDAVKALIDANAPLPGAYIMATRTYATAAKLKEATTNAPLARPPLIAGIPFIPTTRLPINETQGSANNASRVICGDWSQMLVGTRLPVTVSTLVERFADTGQVGFVAFGRYDMQLMHAGAFAQIVGIIP
jgi:HK97 family phage major capsid protein